MTAVINSSHSCSLVWLHSNCSNMRNTGNNTSRNEQFIYIFTASHLATRVTIWQKKLQWWWTHNWTLHSAQDFSLFLVPQAPNKVSKTLRTPPQKWWQLKNPNAELAVIFNLEPMDLNTKCISCQAEYPRLAGHFKFPCYALCQYF